MKNDGLEECGNCHRRFAPESYEKHVNICKKVFMTKRKAFNSAKQRMVDNDQKLMVQKKKHLEPKGP